MNILPNSTTLDDFTIENVIGKGSFGSVYLVRRKQDDKLYALKTVFLKKLNKKEQDNSVNEVRLLASVSHPNVIGYKEAFWDDKSNSLNIIMEYADDGDLQKKINRKRNEGKHFSEKLIWIYSIQMIEGLKSLHDKKIMHRDIKSANIFLTKKKYQCKLGDMNVSKVIKEKVLTTQTGTPYYASPEVWRDEPYSYKSDLWSIGCVIYEMCELRPPFNGKDLDELFENVCSGKIKRINNYYSDDLWNMILMLLQIDVEKRVDCEGFLNSQIINKKIKELKQDPNTHYEACELERNKINYFGDDILFGTINFKNLSDLKNNLPNFKNYQNNNNKNNIIKKNIYFISKSKNDSINNILVTNSSMKTNINQSNTNQNLSLNNNNSVYKGKKKTKKKIALENISLVSNKIFDLVHSKENQSQNQIQRRNIQNKINLIEYKRKQNTSKQRNKNKDLIKKLPKNVSFNGINHSSHKKEKLQIAGLIDVNPTDRNLIIKKDSKNKDYIKIEKKNYKELKKLIEYNKIKEFLKISKKKENSYRTDRRKNDYKKSCGNLLRNKTELCDKINNTKINNDTEDSGNIRKNFSIVGNINVNINKSHLVKKIKTEQKRKLVNRIYKKEFEKYFKKKIIKSPTSISIMNNNKSKERSHSQGINARTIELMNNHKIPIKSKVNNIYFNLITNLSNQNNNIIKKNYLPPHTPYSFNKNKNKSIKRNLTTIPFNNDFKNYIKSIESNRRHSRLLNEIFNTVNLAGVNDNNNNNIRTNNKKSNHLFSSENYTEIDKNNIILKARKIISKKKDRKPLSHIPSNKKRFKSYGFNDNISNYSYHNLGINNSSCNNRNNININDLFSYKNYSIVLNNKNEVKDKIKTKYKEKEYSNYSKVNHNKNSPTINDNFNILSLKQKSMTSSIGGSLSNSNVDIIKKRNSFAYNIKNNVKKKKKVKNISIKKINIPPFCNKNNNVCNNNNYIRYKKGFKSNREFTDCSEQLVINKRQKSNNIKNNKKVLNFSANGNIFISNPNNFLQNVKPIYLNTKNNNSFGVGRNTSNNIIPNKKIVTDNPGFNMKSRLVNSQIFNNYYSINNIDSCNLPVKVINFYN